MKKSTNKANRKFLEESLADFELQGLSTNELISLAKQMLIKEKF